MTVSQLFNLIVAPGLTLIVALDFDRGTGRRINVPVYAHAGGHGRLMTLAQSVTGEVETCAGGQFWRLQQQ
jgi:hypothetical protein